MNKYEIIKTLGQGGYGRANLVRRKTDKKLFVEKEVRLTLLTPKDRESAIQEAKLLASLRHPYIVEYEESFQDKGNLYIVMGYADGGDLAKKIESRGTKLFTEEEILHDFIEISLAIKYIHDRKICHRDLKGQNIFLTKDGTIKLGDFGISKILESTFQACTTQIGTPFYLSPEICNGMQYDTKTDIWSLGCILYELCTLKHAFNATNIAQLMVNIIQARYSPIPSHYSQDLRSLVDKMLTKEPEKRPTINQILNTPYIKKRLSNFLDKNLLEYEMAHTRLHNRKPFAPPTVIISNNDQENNQLNDNQLNDDLLDDSKEIEKQLQLKEAALKKKEAELAARERALQYQSEDNLRARQFYDQKKAMLDNKARMQRELSGNDMKIALQNQYPRVSKSEDSYYDHQNQSNYDQQARENYLEQLRMARANRERMEREELQGSQMKKALMDAQADDDENINYNYRRKNKGNDNFDELNAYMRQQRREAAENKRRLEEAMRGSAAKEALSQTDDYTEQKNHQTLKRKYFNEKTGKFDYDYYSDYYYSDYSDPPPQKQNQKDDNQARNEYMRQLRHEREANRLRAQEYEKRAKEDGNKKQVESSNPQKKQQKDFSDSYIPQKEKQAEMSQEERNAYMRDERQRRRENKEKIEAMGQINMDQLIAEAEAEQKAKSRSNRRTHSRRKMKVDNSQNDDKSKNIKSDKQKNNAQNNDPKQNNDNLKQNDNNVNLNQDNNNANLNQNENDTKDKNENKDAEQSKCCLLI